MTITPAKPTDATSTPPSAGPSSRARLLLRAFRLLAAVRYSLLTRRGSKRIFRRAEQLGDGGLHEGNGQNAPPGRVLHGQEGKRDEAQRQIRPDQRAPQVPAIYVNARHLPDDACRQSAGHYAERGGKGGVGFGVKVHRQGDKQRPVADAGDQARPPDEREIALAQNRKKHAFRLRGTLLQMTLPDSGSPYTVTDTAQARLLTEPRSRDFFKPFLARERSASQAAEELGCSLNTLLYRIKTFLQADLLHVTRQERRAGGSSSITAASTTPISCRFT